MKILTIDDFKISSKNFNLCNPINIIRIFSGFCFFPHALSKFVDGGLNPGLLGFFTKAGFTFPSAEFWMVLAAVCEIIAGIALILGICTRWSALLGASTLVVAVYALWVVKGFGWTWNTGGFEYPVFWTITSIVISIDAWKRFLNKN